MLLRWYLGLGIAGVVVVGRVYQLPAAPDGAKGGVRPEAPWRAYGMATAWDDTDLGEHAGIVAAKIAIVDWYIARTNKPKKPCSAHAQYRKGCHFCEVVTNG